MKKKNQQLVKAPLTSPQHWPAEAREAGINAYLALGSLRKASAATGIPVTTLHDWLHDPANEQILDEARRIHARTAATDAQAVWKAATAHVADALENGDWRISPKGDAIRIPVSAKDAAYIAGTMADKAKQWGEMAHGGQAPADLSPERAEQLAREILRIDKELERRRTVDITPTLETQEPTQPDQETTTGGMARWQQPARQAAAGSDGDVGADGDVEQ